MRGSERQAVATGVATAVVHTSVAVEQVTNVASSRVFEAVGHSDGTVEKVQHAHTTVIHKTIRGVARVAGVVTGTTLNAATPPDAAPVADTTRGAALVAGINCAFGDAMDQTASPLAPEMSIRVAGRAVPVMSDNLRRAFPVARPHLVVFIHGLGGTEYVWGKDFSYADHLRRELDISPVMVRYNTGLPIARNGADFDALLRSLVAQWPIPVESIDIVAHSMGGLVVRSACAQATDPSRWLELTDNIFYLAVPNHGSPMEQAADKAIRRIGGTSIGAPLATLANRRSAGIKDLRYGTITASDVVPGDPERREPIDHQDVPLPEGITHHFIATTVLPNYCGRVARTVGDFLVQPSSALADLPSGNRRPLTPDHTHLLTGRHHNNLLKDDTVYDLLEAALTPVAP